jgi:glycosyltransferase involved in cell wall biosynthesis
MRVLELVDCLNVGGTERQFVELMRGLPAEGFDPVVAVLRKEGVYVDEIGRMGHVIHELPLRGTLIRPNTVRQIVRLASLMVTTGARLIHAHDLYSSAVAVPAARLAQRKVVVSRLDLGHWLSPTTRRLFRSLTLRADHVIVNATAIRSMLVVGEKVPPARITVAANGIDLDDFDRVAAAPPNPAIPQLGGRTLLCVANMSNPVKGHRDLLFAMRRLHDRFPDLRLLLVGDGGLRADLQHLARALHLSSVVVFLGHRRDVPAIAARATVGISASHAEGLSNAILEMMAASRPVVATAVGGSVEIIEDGVTGLLVPPANPEMLADRAADLLHDPSLARRVGEEGNRLVRSTFNRQAMVARFAAVYRIALGDPPSASSIPQAAMA